MRVRVVRDGAPIYDGKFLLKGHVVDVTDARFASLLLRQGIAEPAEDTTDAKPASARRTRATKEAKEVR